MFSVSIPNCRDQLRVGRDRDEVLCDRLLVATATRSRSRPAPDPNPASSHSRAERALVIVSTVVNVFELTMNSVSAGSRSRVASTKSVASTFETKRNVISRLE